MQFKADNEVFDTGDMVCLELSSAFSSVYLHLGRGLAFVQTFDEERGVTIRKASVEQTDAILDYFRQTRLPDMASYKEHLERVVKSASRPAASNSPTPMYVRGERGSVVGGNN